MNEQDIHDTDAIIERLRGIRETLKATIETEEQRKMREAKKRVADEDNPYPHNLRD